MPCTFDLNNNAPRHGGTWRSQDTRLTPAHNQNFVPMTHLIGGLCGSCAQPVLGSGWGSSNYVLCVDCATNRFTAPNLRVVMPQIFLPIPAHNEPEDEDNAEALTTKRDKDFDPSTYTLHIANEPRSGRNGCSGYKCATTAAPSRTITIGSKFMWSNSRGTLCMDCFEKLKKQHETINVRRIDCRCCKLRARIEHSSETVFDGRICNNCIMQHYLATPETDGGWILRSGAAWAIIPAEGLVPARRVYASVAWASSRWFQGNERWYTSAAERDEELYAADILYRDDRIARHVGSHVFAYGTNVIKMHGFPKVTKRDDLCFGVELEMQPNRENTHERVVAALGGKFVTNRPYILCADGSLGSAGVEMITLPYTLANHKSDKYMPWTKVLGDLRKVAQSGRNTTACGMHVHINRRAISNLQLGKMLVVINAPEMQELIVTIAQRNETSYAGKFYKKISDGGKAIGGIHDALSTAKNKGTCELRIFRGNLRYERVMKNLEFAEALCMYALEQSIQKVADPKLMVEWINDNKTHYPHLVKFLAEEYQPTKAFARRAAIARKSQQWGDTCAYVLCEPIEGDI